MDQRTEAIVTAPHITFSLSGDVLHGAPWSQVQSTKIERYWSGESAPVTRHAEAQVCWTDEALLVRFVYGRHEPLVISSNPITHKKTLGLWDRDVCEIFLAPDPLNISRYFEFEVAPTGEWIDLGIVIMPSGRETDWDFESGMSAAAIVNSQTVTAGMTIPWSASLPRPRRGDEWRVNLFRCVGPETEHRYLAWQPTKTPQPNFHVPEVFGRLVFV